eukprot:8394857-Alexandrium_andersonii.AAC.1
MEGGFRDAPIAPGSLPGNTPLDVVGPLGMHTRRGGSYAAASTITPMWRPPTDVLRAVSQYNITCATACRLARSYLEQRLV